MDAQLERYRLDDIGRGEVNCMRPTLGAVVALLLWATPAWAAYPAGHPCVPTQTASVTRGVHSSEPERCPASSAAHYFAWALRHPEWVESGGGGLSPGIAPAQGAPSVGTPSMGSPSHGGHHGGQHGHR